MREERAEIEPERDTSLEYQIHVHSQGEQNWGKNNFRGKSKCKCNTLQYVHAHSTTLPINLTTKLCGVRTCTQIYTDYDTYRYTSVHNTYFLVTSYQVHYVKSIQEHAQKHIGQFHNNVKTCMVTVMLYYYHFFITFIVYSMKFSIL